VIEEQASGEAPAGNHCDAPVSKKLRLMPHEGARNLGDSRGAKSKKELENHVPNNASKWVEFLKKTQVPADENPPEVIQT